MIKMNPADLIPMDVFEGREPITIDLVYARADHPRNIFGEALYHDHARLWAHKDLAALTLMVASDINKNHGWQLEIYDCLRTTDAQSAMAHTQIVKDNPQWCEEDPNRMVSPPGHGAHPRGMAIDIGPTDEHGKKIDMGTPFDDMSEKSARNYKNFSDDILKNRAILEDSFTRSANALGLPLYMIPSEWWDYRFPADTYHQYAPLSDADLPPQMQMTNKVENGINNFDDAHFEKLAESIRAMIQSA